MIGGLATVVKRELVFGPEDPNEMVAEGYNKASDSSSITSGLFGSAAAASGIIVLFLVSIFIWRRELVSRSSIRIIFASSLYNLCLSLIQVGALSGGTLNCHAKLFFGGLFTYLNVFTVTSIAVNLHVVFLRPRWRVPPKHLNVLLIVVPIIVAFVMQLPQTVWGAANGYCDAFVAVDQTKGYYIAYVLFVFIFPSFACVTYSSWVCIRVAIWLIREQKKINTTLNEISSQASNSLGTISGNPANENEKKGITSSHISKDEKRLKAIKDVYSAAFRISLYPLSPLFSLMSQIIFYSIQYHLTMTWKSDVNKFVAMRIFSWLAVPLITWFELLVFMADPSIHKAVFAVWGALRDRFRKMSRKVVPGSTYNDNAFKSSPAIRLTSTSTDNSIEESIAVHSIAVEERVHLLSSKSSVYENPEGVMDNI